jgi:glycosyltransferase involved in cell wall biosynthesis
VFERFGLKRGRYILAVGRLEPTKGFHDLIEAYKRARPAGKKLVIVGAALGDDAYCQTLLAHASKDIVFTGVQNAATLRLLYVNAALFVLPSSLEGSPLVALEAMAAGAPIALSDAPANLEFGLEPHIYFPVGDIAALTALLKRGDFKAHRSARAAALLRENDWDEIARKHLIVFRKLAPASPPLPVRQRDPASAISLAQHARQAAPPSERSPANSVQ